MEGANERALKCRLPCVNVNVRAPLYKIQSGDQNIVYSVRARAAWLRLSRYRSRQDLRVSTTVHMTNIASRGSCCRCWRNALAVSICWRWRPPLSHSLHELLHQTSRQKVIQWQATLNKNISRFILFVSWFSNMFGTYTLEHRRRIEIIRFYIQHGGIGDWKYMVWNGLFVY
jgi:hypothetical protein